MKASLWFVLLFAVMGGCGGNGSPDGVKQPSDAAPAAVSSEPTEPAEVQPPGNDRLVKGTDACQSDEDCAPATCCHPRACVARAKAPQCEGQRCTLNCIGNTIDCGGRCLCHEGKCAAQLAPPLVVPLPRP